jgi:predicted MFS family arabinose efflux permease
MNGPARARWRVSAIFLLHGVIVSNWLARIPAVQQKLGLTAGGLGLALLFTTAGALCSMPLTSRLVGRFQSGAVTRFSSFAFCLVLPLLAVVPKAILLGPALFVFGWAAAAMDVSMNTQAVVVEQALGKPVMTSFHALFSIGGMTGSVMGGLAAALELSPPIHLILLLPLLLSSTVLATRHLLPDVPAPAVSKVAPQWTRLFASIWGLGAIAFCVLMGEGAMADWDAVYLGGLPGVSPGFAAAGYAVFSVAMATGRLLGDHIRLRLPEAVIVRSGALLASVGLFAGLAHGAFPGAVAGFACAGLGFSTIFPILNCRAGQVSGIAPQAGIAAVTAIGYAGFLLGPPLIGLVAQLSSLRFGLCVIALLSATAAALSRIAFASATGLRTVPGGEAKASSLLQ